MGDFEIKMNRELASEKNAIKKLEPMFFELKEELKIPDNIFYNMLIAITEAVNNAIFHGNKCDINKKISISIDVVDRLIQISIADEGQGFDHENVADPRTPENILKENGRGVFLIKNLAETFDFKVDQKGTTVIMTFHV